MSPPGFKGYKPYGNRQASKEPVELLYEEYEAIKLADYDGMNHQEASKLMGISRATFARIYEMARRKVANALVETREIRSVFGNAELDKTWRICENCHARFNIPPNMHTLQCPLCKSDNTQSIKEKE